MTSQGEQVQQEGVKFGLRQIAQHQVELELASEHTLSVPEPSVTMGIAALTARRGPSVDAAPPDVSRLNKIGDQLQKSDRLKAPRLSEDDRRVLKRTPGHVLRDTLPARIVGLVNDEVRRTRTTRIASGEERAHTPLPAQIKYVVQQWAPASGELTVRQAPDGKTLEWVDGIVKPLTGIDLRKVTLDEADFADSKKFAELIMPFTSDPSILLRPAPGSSVEQKESGVVLQFAQFVQHGADQELPLFGYGSRVYVNTEGQINAAKFETVPGAKLSVSGKLPETDCRKLGDDILKGLGIDPVRVESCREGVGLVNKDPGKARLGFEIQVSAGEGRTPIKIFVDGETKRVLYVRSD